MDAQHKSNHGNPAYPPDFKFNELPKNNWHYVTEQDKDRYVSQTLERIKDVYEDVHKRN